jgi:ribonuclease III
VDPALVAPLERRLGHRFRDTDLLARAFVHASWAGENPPAVGHEGLAFLGDAVLGLLVAERLLGDRPDASSGVLTPQRAALVSDANLARWARELEVGPLLRLGRGAEQTGAREVDSVLATTLEALIGALYLDSGLGAVRPLVERLARG